MTKGVKLLALVAFVSLAANLFVAGFWLARVSQGDAAGGGERGRPDWGDVEFTLNRLGQNLSPDAQEMVRETLRDRRGELRPLFFDIRRTRMKIADEFAADEVDADALKALFADMRALRAELQRPVQETIVEVAVSLPAEERRALLDKMRDLREQHLPLAPRRQQR